MIVHTMVDQVRRDEGGHDDGGNARSVLLEGKPVLIVWVGQAGVAG